LTLYSSSIVHDNVSPLPRGRAGINPGIYLSRFPKFPRLDFRAEAAYTDPPNATVNKGQFLYYEIVYHDLCLNDGNLMGSWVGREGKGYQAWSTYTAAPKAAFRQVFATPRLTRTSFPEEARSGTPPCRPCCESARTSS
jgi:Capsule assembly protein Wzi